LRFLTSAPAVDSRKHHQSEILNDGLTAGSRAFLESLTRIITSAAFSVSLMQPAGADPSAQAYRINGFPRSHVALDAEIESIL
jgi:hypothetical protein